jgi:hypothetical protein
MKQKILLVYSIVMYALTTTILIITPLSIDHSFDRAQISLLIIIGIIGFGAGSLALFTYKDNQSDVHRF